MKSKCVRQQKVSVCEEERDEQQSARDHRVSKPTQSGACSLHLPFKHTPDHVNVLTLSMRDTGFSYPLL